MLAAESLLQLAIEQGAVKDFAPISLDVDGSSAHGVLIDHFRVIARASRAASAAGTPIDPKTPSLELMRTRMVVVAHSAAVRRQGTRRAGLDRHRPGTGPAAAP